MGIFSKQSTAKVFTNSKWFTDGQFIVTLNAVKFLEAGHNGDSFVIEAKVNAARNTVAANAPKVGELCAHVWNASGKKKDSGLNTWMQFMGAVFGAEPHEKSDSEWEKLALQVTEDNALEGTVMLLNVNGIITREGNPFTKHNWVREATEEDLAEFGLVETE